MEEHWRERNGGRMLGMVYERHVRTRINGDSVAMATPLWECPEGTGIRDIVRYIESKSLFVN